MATKDKDNVNINLNITIRKKFTIDGDRSRVIELDTHDLALVTRLTESVRRMDTLKEDWEKLEKLADTPTDKLTDDAEIDEATLKETMDFSDQFALVEAKMRDIVDYIFDCPGLCQTVVGNASVFSPINGMYKFEQIIDVLTGLYEESIEKEAKKINKRKVEAKTSKYIRNVK